LNAGTESIVAARICQDHIGWLGHKLYSPVIYKQLELRGFIGDGLPREQGEQE
jgi:hypothetical protein